MESDNMVKKMMKVENWKWPPKNREVGNDLKDGERVSERGKERSKEMIASNTGE